MQRKYADPPPQFADIGRWCGFFMSLRGVAIDHLRAYVQGSPPAFFLSLIVEFGLPVTQSTTALLVFRRVRLYHYRIGFGIRIDAFHDDFAGAD